MGTRFSGRYEESSPSEAGIQRLTRCKTNYLSHWLLTQRLLPILQETSRVSEPGTVRIVCVTSGGHETFAPKGGVRFDDIKLESESGMTRYGQSKLANVLHAKQLHARYGPKGKEATPGEIIVSAVHPGNVDTWVPPFPNDAAA